MKYVLITFFLVAVMGRAENGRNDQIVPIGKKITATPEQIEGLFQIIEKRPPTPEQVEKTKEFLEKNPLPPRELFFQRRETVDNFFENVLGRDPSKAEVRKTMEFLVEQETIAKVKAEEAAKNGSTDDRERGRSVPPGQLGSDTLPSSPSGLDTSELEALKLAAEAGAIGPSGTPGRLGDGPATVSPASQVELDEAIAESKRNGHTGGAGFVPPPEPEASVAVVVPPLPVSVSPPATSATPSSLRADLAEVLDERVKRGDLTPEEGQKAMRDILNEFDSGRRPAEATAATQEVKTPAPIALTPPQELKPSLGSMGPNDPDKVTMPSFMGKWQVTPPPAAPVSTPSAAPVVAEEMSKVLTDFGKLSLSPEGKTGSTPADESPGKLQTAGTGNSAGANDSPSGDNTGLTPSLNVKSGGVVGFGSPESAVPQKKVAGWLNQYVEEYLRRGKTLAGDKRVLASPHPIGLPKGSLTPREEPKVSFFPEGRGDYLFMAQAAPEAFLKLYPNAGLLFWTLLGAAVLRTVLLLRRQSRERDEENRREPKVI